MPGERRGRHPSGSPPASSISSCGPQPGARHSRNIAENPRVSLVIFDSSAAPGEGSAVYVAATAAAVEEAHVEEAHVEEALAIYNERSLQRGLDVWGRNQLSGEARHRLYSATAIEVFVLDDRDERVRVSPA
ncbi:MAG: hypothetical protein ACTHMQ_07645 [Protaetiibacter sp.]